jgi:ABC-type transporter Mla subunit MlaD
MKRILLIASIVLAAGAFLVTGVGASSKDSTASADDPSYTIQLDNAFGLVKGADFKVAGVRAGTLKSIDLDQKTLKALVKVQVTQTGFGSFRTDASCQSRPQSLIGEYFIECDPGQTGAPLKPGSVITNTTSTIAPDLLNNIMRMPIRERFSLILNELGAGVAGRSGDLQAALRRAVPAITQTDNLLALLANDSQVLQDLTANSDAVITALANNSAGVQRFVSAANRAATLSAQRNSDLKASFHKLPALLEQLRPTLAQLGATTDANLPALNNLNASSQQLSRLLRDLVPFSGSSKTAFSSLGQASVTGNQAVQAAGPTVAHLNQFAKPTPELAQNLAIVLHDLDDRGRAVERDPRSPGGAGYTGLEALLQYVFNQTLAINAFGPFGHMLAVDAFADIRCAAFATPATIKAGLKNFGSKYRECYSWLGPNQPGVNTTDPSNPNGSLPDPGGQPPYATVASAPVPRTASAPTSKATQTKRAGTAAPTAGAPSTAAPATSAPATTNATTTPQGQSANGSPPAGAPAINLKKTIGGILGLLGGGSGGGGSGAGGSGGGGSSGGSSGTSTAAPSQGQAQSLLNYLLSP